ncbi:MAG: hypothetical protein QOI26_2058, partial [Pseudonocardiales bacterium]|nr:hypothetical protein [Pseudonocardiales bacterium]
LGGLEAEPTAVLHVLQTLTFGGYELAGRALL